MIVGFTAHILDAFVQWQHGLACVCGVVVVVGGGSGLFVWCRGGGGWG
jgi:hypothetical protein